MELEAQARTAGAKFDELRGFFDLPAKKKRLEFLIAELSKPEIWQDKKKSVGLQQEKKRLEGEVCFLDGLFRSKEDLDVLFELAGEGESVIPEIETGLAAFSERLDEAELQTLFDEEDDPRNAIMTIHPGAGGTESQDWAQILFRMYLRFAERKGFKTEILDLTAGEEAGLKSATVRMEGDFVYGHLNQEIGVHRLVRISPFDSAKRRHTSFAAVFVYPEIDDDIQIEISPDELKIDTYRAGGKGGQHVNTTDSAVRITHLPTGIIVQCQNERSQHKNKAAAMKVLKSRLYELEQRRKREKIDKLEDAKTEIAWGNQIRSYVLHPYRMIKDNRTKLETGNTDDVLDGGLDDFIKAELVYRKQQKNNKT
ncbi:MAG TPA: peptide chain release factor 2, partial [Candidatus Aminicenantes bacterium]|nr:peptide chain release factor 2 [Candidatus Aminicenantes bacterium]